MFTQTLIDELSKLAAFDGYSRAIHNMVGPAFRQQVRDGAAKDLRNMRAGKTMKPGGGPIRSRVADVVNAAGKSASHGNGVIFAGMKKLLSKGNASMEREISPRAKLPK